MSVLSLTSVICLTKVVSNDSLECLKPRSIYLIVYVAIRLASDPYSTTLKYLPNPHALVDESPYATDVHAIHRISGQDRHCVRQMPTGDIRWGLAATQGAHHYFHMDCRGDGTFVDVVCGMKLWVLARLKLEKKRTSINLWTIENLDVTSLDPSQWDIEAVLLTEGTRL